jgi:hypothetical protein
MKILLAAVLATVIAAPCMAKDTEDDRSPADVQVPGKTEPRIPETLKSAPDERIRTEGRASEHQPAASERQPAVRENEPAAKRPQLDEKK